MIICFCTMHLEYFGSKREGEVLKISSVILKEETDGLKPFAMHSLENVVVLVGANGSGKTRMLKLLEKFLKDFDDKMSHHLELYKMDLGNECLISKDEFPKAVNYSHFDANMQFPNNFPPYVISKAKDLLKTCDYEETALNALLLLYDMAFGYSEQFKDGKDFKRVTELIRELCNISVEFQKDKRMLTLCNLNAEEAALSPGQQYLLRIAIACYWNEKNDDLIFFLDEPEVHLHPKALIDCVRCLKENFSNSQFWIATHSLPLTAYLNDKFSTSVYVMNQSEPQMLRSDPTHLLANLMGTEDNIIPIRELLSAPDEYAANRFSIECFKPPTVVASTKNDPQNKMVESFIKAGDIVVDYGAGKGRLFEGIGIDCIEDKLSQKITYYAYDKYPDNAERCKHVMQLYGGEPKNYFNDIGRLQESVNGKADYVMLVNVLHEIDIINWCEVFQNIEALLKPEGELIIVERSELTIGEAPYRNRFLVVTDDSVKVLFGEEFVEVSTHPEREYVVKYRIKKGGLNKINNAKLLSCFEKIKHDSLRKISELKTADEQADFRQGLKMSFWLNQFANAVLSIEEMANQKGNLQ